MRHIPHDILESQPGLHGNGGNGRFRISTDMLIGWVIAALLAYGVVNARVAVLEDRYERVQKDVAEIKTDVKTLLQQGR